MTSREYGAYYQDYINLVGQDELLPTLVKSGEETVKFFQSVPDSKMEYAYAEGKWTIKEIIQHLIDAERVFAYRALRFGRKDATDLPGFEHNDYVPVSKANDRTKEQLIDDYRSVRNSTIKLYEGFDDEMLKFIGTANGNPMSARALAFIMSGHEKHHIKVIAERYL